MEIEIYGMIIGRCATVAQSVEQLIRNQQVGGSIPSGGFKKEKRKIIFY
jgi:hypothetical protein